MVSRTLVVVIALAMALGAVFPVLGQDTDEGDICEHPPDGAFEICGSILEYWESHGGETLFGLPLTAAYEERSSDTLEILNVQYFENARIEQNPRLAGTDWEISLGRLGSEVLEYGQDLDWWTFSGGDPSDPHYFAETGHSVAPEFWETYRASGLDLGDPGISLRESVALHGYPLSQGMTEVDSGVQVQWFERARFSSSADGVVVGRLGVDMTDTAAGFSPRIIRELDANLVYWLGALDVPGVMAGIWVPEVGEWSNVVGVKSRETGEPLQFDDHMRVGSITKTFTGTLIMQLDDLGLLSIDDPVSMYVEGVPNGDRITLRNLADMTSGLASYTFDPTFQDELFSNPEREWEPEEVLAIGFANTEAGCPYAPPNWPACFDPGTSFFYSNTNTVLLGRIVEIVSGMTYAEALQEMIFDPLGLENTSFPVDGSLPDPFAHGYTFQGLPDDATEQQDATFWNPSWGFAVGDLVSQFEDLRVWARALGVGELLSPEMQAERLEKLPPGFGNGIITADRSYAFAIGYLNGWWGHEGELPGYNATVYYLPEADASIVVAVNSDSVPYEDTVVSPAGTITNVLIEIAAREAPLGDFSPDAAYGGTLP